MKQIIIEEIVQKMLPYLDNAQMQKLQETLQYTLFNYEISGGVKVEEDDTQKLVESFLYAKRIEGCSEKTIKYYSATIEAMLVTVDKGVRHIHTDDLRAYLTNYQENHGSSRVTIDNIRRILSSFFSWLEDEDYILKSPVRRIHKVKTATNIKETYTVHSRSLNLISALFSNTISPIRIPVEANISTIARSLSSVFGKGDKERVVYFDARTKIHLQNYIDSRTDDNPALFVTLRAPHTRITIGGIESRLREMGRILEIEKVHPHKFRRTLATMAIDKGMPIEQLQQLLGHKRIDTTLQYAMVKQSNVKQAHRKYIG